ncbi:methyltransferase [Actinoplanes sp. NPDC051633]|uniref:class I SAM-dependent methyltransferase n=1 Tax=Actinoplanes sp. NPDC051633 TaxID=3155670 RepID=UPI0034318F11
MHVNWAERGPHLIAGAEVTAPMVDQALSWLAGRVTGARMVLDIGSGPGVAACSLAELLPDSEVLAVDGTPELLELAERRAADRGLADRVRVRPAILPDQFSELPPADLVWVSGVAHHMPDPAEAVREMAALVRPGGVLALREGGLPMRCLPDHADGGLLARINVVTAEASHAHHHPMGAIDAQRGWPQLLREAGLTEVQSRTFLLDLPAPLGAEARDHLRNDLRTSREMLADRLSAADLTRLDHLTSDTDPESVLHRDDAFLLMAATIHTGTQSTLP